MSRGLWEVAAGARGGRRVTAEEAPPEKHAGPPRSRSGLGVAATEVPHPRRGAARATSSGMLTRSLQHPPPGPAHGCLCCPSLSTAAMWAGQAEGTAAQSGPGTRSLYAPCEHVLVLTVDLAPCQSPGTAVPVRDVHRWPDKQLLRRVLDAGVGGGARGRDRLGWTRTSVKDRLSGSWSMQRAEAASGAGARMG